MIADLQDWLPILRAGDELQREVAEGRVFAGFTDALTHCFERGHNVVANAADGAKGWTFAPTFKMKRAVAFGYNPQRVPSFTDRVLWRSAPGREQCIELDSFAPEFVRPPIHLATCFCVALADSDRATDHLIHHRHLIRGCGAAGAVHL